MRSLKVHAGKARSFLEVQGRLKEVQVKANLHRFHLSLLEVAEVDSRILIAVGERDLCILDRDRLRASHAEVEGELRAANESLTTARERCISPSSASSSPARPRVTAPTGCTWTSPASRPSSQTRVAASAVSVTGEVFAIASTAV